MSDNTATEATVDTPAEDISRGPDDTVTATEPEKTSDKEELDDLFGDDDDEENNSESEKDTHDRNASGNDDEDDDEINYSRSRSHGTMDEEEAMYTRKFYGEDADNYSADEDADRAFKEVDVELVRHMVPYLTNANSKTESPADNSKDIYYAKVPQFLTIDAVPFDPPSFETTMKQRLSQAASEDDQIGDRLVEENTIRWRYSRDSNQRVFKESNAQIVQWSDGSFSLKLGDEYTDILVNNTDNTFLAVSHDQQELMQCSNGGEINKTMMFIPTSTNSKIHNRLSKAVARKNKIEHDGPGTYLVQVDPEIEKKQLETKQQQIFRERRRRQVKENELLASGEAPTESFGRRSTPKPVSRRPGRGQFQDEYEEDDFLVDDDEDENEYEDEEADILDGSDDEEADERNAQRLKNSKSSRSAFEDDEDEEDSGESRKRRRTTTISDDEDEE